jgi:hypothetical protein
MSPIVVFVFSCFRGLTFSCFRGELLRLGQQFADDRRHLATQALDDVGNDDCSPRATPRNTAGNGAHSWRSIVTASARPFSWFRVSVLVFVAGRPGRT